MRGKKLLIGKLKPNWFKSYRLLDRLYVPRDLAHVQRTRNLRLLPTAKNRRGGKHAFSEWAHVIGIFQTLIRLNLRKSEDNVIVDVGCGTGLLAIAAEPFLGQSGKYVGIDITKPDVDFCRRHYRDAHFEFIHLDANNPGFVSTQKETRSTWPLQDESADMATALSVWTHFGEEDALFYLEETGRVLKPGGRAIITLFTLDDLYEKSLQTRTPHEGRFNKTRQDQWIFDQSSYGSDAWRHPQWVKTPEDAIGVTSAGLERLTAQSGLKLIEQHPGNWKEIPGLFFQDILIFEKPLK